MKWVLVYIALAQPYGNSFAMDIGMYDDMIECFLEREKLAVELGSTDGYFPVNTQAICVPFESQ